MLSRTPVALITMMALLVTLSKRDCLKQYMSNEIVFKLDVDLSLIPSKNLGVVSLLIVYSLVLATQQNVPSIRNVTSIQGVFLSARVYNPVFCCLFINLIYCQT